MTKDEQVIYNLFDWANSPNANLILITIANTFDLRLKMHGRVRSRMGMQTVTFKGYDRDSVC